MSQDSEPVPVVLDPLAGDRGKYPPVRGLRTVERLVSRGWVDDETGRRIAEEMAKIILHDGMASRRDRIMAARVYAAFRQGDLREEANAIQDRGQTQSAHQRALAALLSSEEGRRILSSLSSIPQLDLSDSVQPVNVTPPVTPQSHKEKEKCPEGGGIHQQMDTIVHRDEHGLAPPPARVQAEHKPLGATRRRQRTADGRESTATGQRTTADDSGGAADGDRGRGGAPPGAQQEDPPG